MSRETERMKIRTQIFEETLATAGDIIEISQENMHHLKNVLRVKEGEFIKIVLNKEKEALAEVVFDKKILTARILKTQDVVKVPNAVTSLCFAVCKSAQNELVCEKATELGVDNIIFWVSEHTGIKVKELSEKVVRLKKIAEAAARQSKQDFIPEIVIKNNLAEVVSHLENNFSNNVILYASLADGLKCLEKKFVQDKAAAIHLFIGPEGGFSAKEEEFLHEKGQAFSLGNSVLKAETAAIVSIAQVQLLRCYE